MPLNETPPHEKFLRTPLDMAINCQDIADTAAIDVSPFKTDVLKQPKPPFTLIVSLVAITREQDGFNLHASNRRAAERS